MSKDKKLEELPDDIEVTGPGQMLAQAREEMGLSQQDVADRLNFRTTLVKEIEQEIFDKSLPATFNRGYLRNYAKLVNISVEDVLTSYEMLNVAQKQGAEMQSFSKQTQKQAENTRIMWLSYLILALLIAATIIWWLQDSEQKIVDPSAIITDNPTTTEATDTPQVDSSDSSELPTNLAQAMDSETVRLADTLIANGQDAVQDTEQVGVNNTADQKIHNISSEEKIESEAVSNSQVPAEPVLSEANDFGAPEQVEFTFSGDCWVNIYDATGERIAWGIKKSGYVMNISGQAPFTITLGKPELVSIVYQQQTVDMSQFSRGNIAKFTLPIQ